MSEKEISNLKKKFSTLNNIWFYEKPDYFDYFKSSDALILDSISFISEYYPTKKPIFFITKSNMHKFNKYGDLIMDGVYKGWEPVEIDDFINNVVEAGKDPMYNRRITILKNNIYIPQEGAGLKIVNYLKKELYNGENSK